jgi:hypothetical protein
MAEGLLSGILGEEDEKAEVETPDAMAGAEPFASAVAAKLAGNDPEVARRTSDFLIDQSQLLRVTPRRTQPSTGCHAKYLRGTRSLRRLDGEHQARRAGDRHIHRRDFASA